MIAPNEGERRGRYTKKRRQAVSVQKAGAAFASIEDPIDDATLGLQDALSTIEKGQDFEGKGEVDEEEEMGEEMMPVSFGSMVFR